MDTTTRSLVLIGLLVLTSAAHAQRGQLLENPPAQLGAYSRSDLIGKITDGTLSQWVLRRAFTPQCDVVVYQLRYATTGARGEPTTASGALMVPNGSLSACQGPRPIVLYAHGKRNLTSFNIADISGQTNYEGLLLALALAGDGYIVVAPNYAGYDSSTLGYHPFLHADQQSGEMIDALTAARAALPAANTADNQKLFITGYSEGGHVAMATQRALEASGVPVTASAPMSGPYALTAFADAVFLGQVGLGAVEEFIMLAASFQQAYGNIYSSPTEIFEPKYASAASLLPGTTDRDTLILQGQIPNGTVFSSTPPAPELAELTPAVTDARYADVFALGFGTDHLITNSYRLSYLRDALANPDGAYPDTTTSLPPENPGHTLRQALKKNDLRNWAPSAPVLLCAGDEDPVVFYLNTQLMQGYWAANAPDSSVTVLDVDAPPSQDGPYQHLRERFAETKRIVRLIEGRSTVLATYHDVLVPAACMQAARSFFDSF
jgi:alpha/beta superfamily hydrolase